MNYVAIFLGCITGNLLAKFVIDPLIEKKYGGHK